MKPWTPVLLFALMVPATPVLAAAGSALEPATLTAPAEGAMIPAGADPTQVTLVWKVAPQPAHVRFFVEVVAIDHGTLPEVFASYVDHATVTVTLNGKSADYAWRIYTVAQTAPDYALSAWGRFSVRAGK